MLKILSSSRRRYTAFTLVELLVVMGIIAILAGAALVGVSSALRFAKRTKANTTASQIATAVQNYYTEYGVYPTADAAGGTPTDDFYSGTSATTWTPLMYALCGNINPYTGAAATGSVPNTRNIAYLSPTHSDIDSTGSLLNPFDSVSNGTATGPSANNAPYFYMVVDTDYSGVVGDSSSTKLPDFTKYSTNYTGATLASGTPGGVAVWSPCDQPLAGGTASKASPASYWAHTY